MRARYLAIVVFAALVFMIFVRDKKRTLRNKIQFYGTMFIEGMVGGLIIDSIGVNAGYYTFPRQSLYSLDYWLIVIPCWGVFGLLLNCLWDWFGKEKFLRSMAVSILPLFIFYEGSNLITGSWVYNVPFYVVLLGWIPLGWVFAGCNKRRRVIFKIESMKLESVGFKSKLFNNGLIILKDILIVVMFPLLLMLIIKWVTNLGMVLKDRLSVREYTKVMVKTWLAMS
jgi:hypothetical protein